VIAGIRPGAPGYARLRIAPVLGDLTSLDAAAATPKGAVSVKYKIEGGKLAATIDRPAALPGEFVWNGKSYPLTNPRTSLLLDR
jgi:alpha-L-rhamnosidase